MKINITDNLIAKLKKCDLIDSLPIAKTSSDRENIKQGIASFYQNENLSNTQFFGKGILSLMNQGSSHRHETTTHKIRTFGPLAADKNKNSNEIFTHFEDCVFYEDPKQLFNSKIFLVNKKKLGN